jgi:hypothetical protein
MDVDVLAAGNNVHAIDRSIFSNSANKYGERTTKP